MNRYKKVDALREIGKRLKKKREEEKLQIEDVVEMTGFTYKKIVDIEAGEETSLSYFLEICLAIKVHPKEVLNFKIDSKPRFMLSPSRKEKSRITYRLNEYLKNGYFDNPRTTGEVVDKLKKDFKITPSSSDVSAILRRFNKINLLKIVKRGKRNIYSKR